VHKCLNVLLIEDSEDDALLVLRSLQKDGLAVTWERVETAAQLQGALAGDRPWDVIISDYNLPGFSAPQALAMVQTHGQDIPFIVVSGTIGDTAAVNLMKAGVHDYLMKDNLTRLAETVRREIREAQVRQDNRETLMALDATQERLQLALEGSAIGLWDWALQSGHMLLNDRWADMLGWNLDDIHPLTIDAWLSRVHPKDLVTAQALLDQHLQGDRPSYTCELRMRHRAGHWIWVLDQGKVVEWDRTGRPLRMIGTQMDITHRKQAELRLALQSRVLERIAMAVPLPEILDLLVRGIEEQLGDSLCSVLLSDGNGCLRSGAAPNLPDAYNRAIDDGIPIREGVGSCGTAAARRQLVVVDDTLADPLWQSFQGLAQEYGLRSCWSAPALANTGDVLGTFAVYSRRSRTPQPQELELIDLATNILKIAIERETAAQALAQMNQELEERVIHRTMALQESESKLQAILNFAPAAVYVKDLDRRHTLVNQSFLSIFDCELDHVIGCSNQEFFGSEVGYFIDRNDQQVLTSRQFYQYEEEIPVGDRLRTFLSNKFPLLDQERNPYAICGISLDITENKAAQEALRQNEERLKRITANIPGVIYQYVLHPDRSHQFVYVSDRAQDIFELEPSAILANADVLFNLVHGEDVASLQTSIKASEQTLTPWTWEGRLITPSGQQKWIQGIAHPEHQTNGSILWDGLLLDVSDRKRAEELLQESEFKYRSLVENANDIIYIMATDGTFTYVSPNWTEMLGHAIEEVVNHSFIPFVHPDDVPRCLEFLQRLVSSRSKQRGVEYRVCHKNGEWRWYTSNASPQYDAQGQIRSCLGIAHDITERKQAEELLQRTNAELVRATRLKDEFLANMSHELRTPLNAVLGMAEGLQEQVFGSLNARQIRAIATIENSGRHLLELINDILDLSKIEAGGLDLNLEDVSIQNLCSTSLSFVKQPAMKKQISLLSDIPETLGALNVQVDDRRMRQVLINLLSNAVKFTPEGGQVLLQARLGYETPDLSPGSPADTPSSPTRVICFSVIDTGIGIAEEDVKRLFQPFVQIDSSLSRKYPGTGLGLAIVKQIAQLHGGHVSVTSNPGQGSCFTVTLPCPSLGTDPPTAESTHNDAESSGAIASVLTTEESVQPLILLTEDNEANILTLSSYLTAKRYRLLHARSGEEAIAVVGRSCPDIILMDIQMPGMDGLEAIRQIRQLPEGATVPIIALTALAMTGDRDRCLAAGANDYLTKPVRLRQLHMTIQDLLEAQLRSQLQP
jgi:PAS domain S-box-containing protein